jgi:hypothetical protein
VLVRLPYRDADGVHELLVCVLVKHQSDPDQAMPLRLLVSRYFSGSRTGDLGAGARVRLDHSVP